MSFSLSKYLMGGAVDTASKAMNSAGNFSIKLRTALTGVDPEVKAEIEKSFAEHQQDLSMIEAKSPLLFIAGWRPAIGWVCVMALFMYYVVRAVVMMSVWVFQVYYALNAAIDADTVLIFTMIPPPAMAIGDILGLVGTLLGMGTMRSIEKNKKSENNR